MKNKSLIHFLEETFWPAESKSLRLRSAAFEMQLSCAIWFHQTTLKQFLVCSEKVYKQLFMSPGY